MKEVAFIRSDTLEMHSHPFVPDVSATRNDNQVIVFALDFLYLLTRMILVLNSYALRPLVMDVTVVTRWTLRPLSIALS